MMLDTCVQYLLEFPLCSANKNSQYVLEEYRLKEYGTTKSEEGVTRKEAKGRFAVETPSMALLAINQLGALIENLASWGDKGFVGLIKLILSEERNPMAILEGKLDPKMGF